jgi:hypothetical protein
VGGKAGGRQAEGQGLRTAGDRQHLWQFA